MNTRPIVLAMIGTALLVLSTNSSQAQSSGVTLEARVAEFERLISNGDLTAAIDVLPPRLIEQMARQFDMRPEDIKPATEQAMAQVMQGVQIQEFGFELSRSEELKTPDGTRTYLLIPTHTVMRVEGRGRFRSDNKTLAMRDGVQWYLIRIDDANQVGFLKTAYPEFAEVQFPTGTMRALQ